MKTTIYAIAATLSLCSLVHAEPEGCGCKPMPKFSAVATDGKTYTNDTFCAKPTVVVFLRANCPANPGAMADLNRLASQLGAKVAFVGVTNMTAKDAKAYAAKLGAKFPVVADPDKKIVDGFGAKKSLDMALICPKDKKIAQSFDGYSRATIKAIVAALPGHGGPKLALDLGKYPTAKKSGCSF